MLTEKQARAVCEALGVLPDSRYPFARTVVCHDKTGRAHYEYVTNWQAAQRAAEEASD